jgi:cytochrome c553
MKKSLFSAAIAVLLIGNAYAQDLKGSAAAGKTKNAMCIGCHGIPDYKASFPSVYRAPMIAGQNAQYIEAALAAYKKSERKHPTMRAIAASLTPQDMADLGAYYASLK